ncbi:hypothetical protein CR513_25328, partial [Mucuna pruriens]
GFPTPASNVGVYPAWQKQCEEGRSPLFSGFDPIKDEKKEERRAPIVTFVKKIKAHLLRSYGVGFFVCSSINNEYLAELKIRDNLKGLIVRMFYYFGLHFNLARNNYFGLHFNLARNPYYINSYLFATNNNLSGFIHHKYNALRTTLLQQEKTHVERLLKPIKSTWKEKGISIVSYG